jgi:hypothetical protein
MKAKTICVIAPIVLSIVLAMNFHRCLGLCKYAVGSAKFAGSSQAIEVKANGQPAKATLHLLEENILYAMNGGDVKSPCYILLVEDGIRIPPLKIGLGWVGGFSYGGENLASFGNSLLVSETARSAYDLRDEIKGGGDSYSIEERDGRRSYAIKINGSPSLELTLDKAQAKLLDSSLSQ